MIFSNPVKKFSRRWEIYKLNLKTRNETIIDFFSKMRARTPKIVQFNSSPVPYHRCNYPVSSLLVLHTLGPPSPPDSNSPVKLLQLLSTLSCVNANTSTKKYYKPPNSYCDSGLPNSLQCSSLPEQQGSCCSLV